MADINTDQPQFPSNLRGGGDCCADVIIGGCEWEWGPFVCTTKGTGCCGCVGCCVCWPLNCLIGGTWGICNFLTCGACDNK